MAQTPPLAKPSNEAWGPAQALHSAAGQEQIKGVWAAPQLGKVLDANGGRPAVYHRTASACWPEPNGATLLAENMAFASLHASGQRLRVSAAPGASHNELLRLPELPPECGAPVDASPQASLAAALDMFDAHYAFFNERGIDWLAAKGRAQATFAASPTEQGLYTALTGLMELTQDAHVTLQAEVDGKPRRFSTGRGATLTALRKAFELQRETRNAGDFYNQWIASSRDTVNAQLLGGKGKAELNGKAFWGVAPNGGSPVGYLSLSTFEGYTRSNTVAEDIRALNSLLDAAFEACASCKGMVIDLSQNRGGDDRVALALAGRFAQAPVPAYTKQACAKSGCAEAQTFAVQPSAASRFTAPLVLLSSSVTVSAGEIGALALRALPRTTHAGEQTRGALSDALAKRLPNGWQISLSHEVYRSPDGTVHEAKGIAPTQPLKVFDDAALMQGQAAALRQALQLLR